MSQAIDRAARTSASSPDQAPDSSASSGDETSWWSPPTRFVLESIIGVLVFGVVAAAAYEVSTGVHLLEKQGVDVVIAYGLRLAEYFLFAADLGLFMRFLFKSFLRTWKAM